MGEASSASYGNYAGAELTAAMGNFNFMGGYVNFKDMYKDGWSDDTTMVVINKLVKATTMLFGMLVAIIPWVTLFCLVCI